MASSEAISEVLLTIILVFTFLSTEATPDKGLQFLKGDIDGIKKVENERLNVLNAALQKSELMANENTAELLKLLKSQDQIFVETRKNLEDLIQSIELRDQTELAKIVEKLEALLLKMASNESEISKMKEATPSNLSEVKELKKVLDEFSIDFTNISTSAEFLVLNYKNY